MSSIKFFFKVKQTLSSPRIVSSTFEISTPTASANLRTKIHKILKIIFPKLNFFKDLLVRICIHNDHRAFFNLRLGLNFS